MNELLLIGNWKLYGSKYMINDFINKINNNFNYIEHKIIISPPFIYLNQLCEKLKNINKNIYSCAQNVDINLYGSFTGEISVKMLKDIGVSYVILGHSERRLLHKETDELISNKFFISKSENIIPILCIGETKEENYKNLTKEKCIDQISYLINKYNIEILNNSIIAYEPIWAIGSGIYPDPNKIQNLFNYIRNYLKNFNKKISENINLLYGGSISSKNIYDFVSKKDINGVLIGKSSINIEEFIKIINILLKTKKSNYL